MSAPIAPVLNPAEVAGTKPKPRNSLLAPIGRYLARFDDGELVRWIFRGVLVGTIAVLAQDLRELYQQNGAAALETPAETTAPVLPPVAEPDGATPADPRRFVTGDPEALRLPMRFSLGRTSTPEDVDEATVVFDGANFVVLFDRRYHDSYNPMRAVRVSPAGVVLDAGAWREAGRYSDGDVARIPPFEGIELDVGRLFHDTKQIYLDARQNAAEFNEPRLRTDAMYTIVDMMGWFLRRLRLLRIEITRGEMERAARGEEIVITKHGRPMARLVSAQAHDQERGRKAVERLKELRRDVTLGGVSWRDLRDEGRA